MNNTNNLGKVLNRFSVLALAGFLSSGNVIAQSESSLTAPFSKEQMQTLSPTFARYTSAFSQDLWQRKDLTPHDRSLITVSAVIARNQTVLMPSSMLDKLKVDEWDRMIDVNIKGVLYGIAAALPYMQKQCSGQVINVSSVAGHKVGPGGSIYAGTKWAVRAISEGLRQEVKPWNIRTTIVSPGAVSTELIGTITDQDVAKGMTKTYENALPASSFARVVAFAIGQPEDMDVNEILFRPTCQAY